MNTRELQKKYLTIYDNLKSKGAQNKVLMLLLTIPASFYAYLVLESHNWEKYTPHYQIVLTMFGMAFVMILIVLSIKSFSFVNWRKTNSFKYYFKTELFDAIKSEIPEICAYVYNQKIHQKIFDHSKLFKSQFSDYIGDDWITGRFNENTFEMCELHVFNLFKNIFSGIFTRIKVHTNSINILENIALNRQCISDFEAKHKAKVIASQNQREIYVAIKMNGNFFEGDNPKMIKSIENDITMLKDIISLLKRITGADMVKTV
jgi:hypothetical protein